MAEVCAMENQTGASVQSLVTRLRTLLRRVLVISGLIGLAIAIPCLVVPLWRVHFFNLLARTTDLFLPKVGTSGIGFHALWVIPVITLLVTLIVLRSRKEKDTVTRWEEAKLGTRILLIAVGLFYGLARLGAFQLESPEIIRVGEILQPDIAKELGKCRNVVCVIFECPFPNEGFA
jgi:hypothetical protein